MQNAVECTEHSDCPGDMMCTGVGTCVVPSITVLNNAHSVGGGDMTFKVHTGACPGTNQFQPIRNGYFHKLTTSQHQDQASACEARLHGGMSQTCWCPMGCVHIDTGVNTPTPYSSTDAMELNQAAHAQLIQQEATSMQLTARIAHQPTTGGIQVKTCHCAIGPFEADITELTHLSQEQTTQTG